MTGQRSSAPCRSATSLTGVLVTDELALRPARLPDHAAENRALVQLASILARSPQNILQHLAEQVRELCHAGSAGVSIEEVDGDAAVFRWQATAGEFNRHLGESAPRDASPCGVVVDRGATQLMRYPIHCFPFIGRLQCEIAEALLVPFYVDGRAVGTVWVIAHDEDRQFDAEDARIVEHLAHFASAAYAAHRTSNEAKRIAHESANIAERYRALFDAIDEGFCIIEMMFDDQNRAYDYRFLEVNPVFEKHTSLKDAAGKTMRELVPDHEDDWFEIYGKVALTGESIRFENEAEQLEGRWFDLFAFRVGGEGSRLVGVVFREITERRRAEQAVRESEGRLQLAVEIAQLGTFEIDLITDQVVVNETGRNIYGWSTNKTNFAEVQKHFHPDDRAEVLGRVSEAFDPTGPQTFEVEQRIVRNDGEVRWIRVRGRALFEGEGENRQAVRCVGTYLDITERRQIEEALREADRRKDEFLAVLAHELRNPLAPIRNGLQIMRLASDDPAVVAEAREVMERQLVHMVRLIDDLLDVSRISRNKVELRRSRVLLSDVISNSVEVARPLIDSGSHQLSVSLPPEPVYLDADLTRLAQVFANLLTNSAKYTPVGGRIWLSARCEGETVVVAVRDTGIGIPAEAKNSIFEMFSQVDRSLERSTGGLGIGLALVKGLVELHGGSIQVESDGAGMGSTFTVVLPLLADEVMHLAGHVVVPAPGAMPKRRVLVVDDNHDSADTLAKMLRLHGSEVAVAYDGVAAVDTAERVRPEIILMDVGMPRRNGYDATRRIRETEWGKDIVIVALTGWGQTADVAQSSEAGCDDHLVKPVNIAALEQLFARQKH